jgi:ABC-2 type transport system ATP-binding protein
MTEKEPNAKFDSMVEFADIGRFLDQRVGNYSSGMFARLGFAVAVHTDSDIFLG